MVSDRLDWSREEGHRMRFKEEENVIFAHAELEMPIERVSPSYTRGCEV